MFYLVSQIEGPEEIVESAERPRGLYDGGIYASISAGYSTEAELRAERGILDDPCPECGGFVSTHYESKTKERLVARNLCFSCDFWTEVAESPSVIVVKGHAYSISPNVYQNTRWAGFGGDKFVIRMADGTVKTTRNLWHRGTVPNHFRDRLPDNAEFTPAGRTSGPVDMFPHARSNQP